MNAIAFGSEWSAGLRRGSETELRSWLDVAIDCCRAADEIAMSHFRRDLEISTKPDRTFVTEADQAIERLVRERLTDRYPDHGLVGEEYGTSAPDAPVRWYVDPIDGTHNFMRGVPLFGTLIALERDGELQLGVMSAPALRERWFAARGLGAWGEGTGGDPTPARPIRVSSVGSLGDAQVVYGSAQDIARSGKAPGFGGVLESAWRDRGFGDFWGYALVATGAAEAMVEADLAAWDLAAPAIVVEEAGGLLTDFGGTRSITNRSALATNGRLHGELLRRLAGDDAPARRP